MQLGTKGIVILVIGTIAGGFVAGFFGSRLPELIKGEKKVPKTVAAIVEEPNYVKMDNLESTVEEQVVLKFKPYEQKLDSWDSDKESIKFKLDKQGERLEGLESVDDYFHGIVEEGTERFVSVENNVQKNQEEIQEVKEELGPDDKYEIQMVYSNSALKPKFNLSAYNDKLYIDDLFYVVEEWQKNDVNRVAIVERPHGKGKAVFFAGVNNRFNVEFIRSEEGIDKLYVLSAINSISSLYTMSRTEALPRLEELFDEYGNASLLPFRQSLKKPAVGLLFGEEPEIIRYKGKHYVR